MNERLSKYEDHVILEPVVRYLKAEHGDFGCFFGALRGFVCGGG